MMISSKDRLPRRKEQRDDVKVEEGKEGGVGCHDDISTGPVL